MNADLLDLEVMIKNIVVERYLVKVLLCMLFPYGKCVIGGGGGGGGSSMHGLYCDLFIWRETPAMANEIAWQLVQAQLPRSHFPADGSVPVNGNCCTLMWDTSLLSV